MSQEGKKYNFQKVGGVSFFIPKYKQIENPNDKKPTSMVTNFAVKTCTVDGPLDLNNEAVRLLSQLL
jgi:hypothetical protein